MPAKVSSKVKSIVLFENELKEAQKGQSITITLEDEIDASRGDVFVAADSDIGIANSFVCTLLWMSEDPMVVGQIILGKNKSKVNE